MAPALTYRSLPSPISTAASAATSSSSDYSFVFIIVALISLFLGLGCYAYRAAHREQGEVLEVTSEQCALHFIATKGQDILNNFYEHIPDGLLGKSSVPDEVLTKQQLVQSGRARASSTSVVLISMPVGPTVGMRDKGSHRKSQSLPITKFDAQKEAALTKIALLGEARRIDVLSTASDETIKTILALPVASQVCAEITTNLKSVSQAVDGNVQVSAQRHVKKLQPDVSKPAIPNGMSNICSTLLSKEADDSNDDKFTEAKDSFNANIASPEHETNVGLGIYKAIADSENSAAVDFCHSTVEDIISSKTVSSVLETDPAVLDSSVLFAHILEETPGWLLGNGIDSSWTIEAIDDFSSSDDNESSSSLSGDFPPTPPQEQHHQVLSANGLLCSLPCLADLASVADGSCDFEEAASDSFFATLKQDEANTDLKTNTEDDTFFLSSLPCSSDLASIAERLYEISDLGRKGTSLNEGKQKNLEDSNDDMDVADMSFVLESSSDIASCANAEGVPGLKLNGISTNADVLEASYQDMRFYDTCAPLQRSLLSEIWEPLGPAIRITANVKARGLDKRENDIYFGELTLRVLTVKVHASYTRLQFYEAVSKELGGEVEIEGGIVIDEIEDFVSLRTPDFYPDWIQSCVDAGGVGEINCWRPQYYL